MIFLTLRILVLFAFLSNLSILKIYNKEFLKSKSFVSASSKKPLKLVSEIFVFMIH